MITLKEAQDLANKKEIPDARMIELNNAIVAAAEAGEKSYKFWLTTKEREYLADKGFQVRRSDSVRTETILLMPRLTECCRVCWYTEEEIADQKERWASTHGVYPKKQAAFVSSTSPKKPWWKF